MNKLIALSLIFILSTAITGAVPVDVGYLDNTYPALDYTGAWSVVGDDNVTSDYTASLTFDVFSDGLTIFFTFDPNGDDLSVCVDLTCQTVSTLGVEDTGRITVTDMADGLKTITLSKNTDDSSLIKIDAIYIHPYESLGSIEFSRDEVELITFEYDSETYNAALDYTISAGDTILAIMLAVLILIQLFQFVKSAWEVEV